MEPFKTTVSETHARIWEVVRAIPKGRVSTYGSVAGMAGFPGHARLVGYALHALPSGTDVPWHRVINSRGMISLRKGGNSHAKQRRLLEGEGVVFVKGRIRLELFGWDSRPVGGTPSRTIHRSGVREKAGI